MARPSNAQPPAPDVPAEAKQDFEQAKQLKENAAKDFKAKDYNSACEKYYKIISVVRQNEKLKETAQGKEFCTTSRLNIALCKFTTKQYDEAIDQCERVLDTEPKNWKASFRLANSLYMRANENPNDDELRTIGNYAKKALEGNPNDAKIKEFNQQITEKQSKLKKDKTETFAQEMSEEEFKKWAKKDDEKKQDASNENYEDIDETPKLKKMKISDP